LKFLFIEPFYGGSHRDFADGLTAFSKHQIDLITLPARFWKWRMRGAALYLYQKIKSFGDYDGLITTDLMSLSDLKALCGSDLPPSLVYFHETQLTYPLAPGERIDYQFGFTDITTALASDKILFNSHTHYKAFFSQLPAFIKMMPEFRPTWVVEKIRDKTGVLYPGCHFSAEMSRSEFSQNDLPLIIWNHRWEFDKRPDDFFNALEIVLKKNIDFKIAILGENYQKVPKAFLMAKKNFENQIVHYGYVESREEYYKWLSKGDIVVSTADQENFGISIIEAVRLGCLPLVPNRLSYPEIIPDEFHEDFLFQDQDELVKKLIFLLSNLEGTKEKRIKLSESMNSFAWENQIKLFDNILQQLSDL
jgi:glycosyltransferase involved in cell wall biosynthesis